MSDGKVTSVDSGAKKKVKRGGVGTKQVCGGSNHREKQAMARDNEARERSASPEET